jgi:hypothetical protein
MHIKLNKLNILEYSPKIFEIEKQNTPIIIEGDIPKDSIIKFKINKIPFECWVLIPYKETQNQNVFEGTFQLDKPLLEFLQINKSRIYITLIVNNIELPEEIEIHFDRSKFKNKEIQKIESLYTTLIQKINKLELKLNAFVNKEYTRNPFVGDVANIREGMIPIAVDNVGNFRYDYPNVETKEILASLTQIISKTQELNLINSERLTKLEQDLFNHVHNKVI